MKQVTLFPKGDHPEVVAPQNIMIPDLWHLAMWLKDSDQERSKHKINERLDARLKAEGVDVLRTWHLAHELARILMDVPDTSGLVLAARAVLDGMAVIPEEEREALESALSVFGKEA